MHYWAIIQLHKLLLIFCGYNVYMYICIDSCCVSFAFEVFIGFKVYLNPESK